MSSERDLEPGAGTANRFAIPAGESSIGLVMVAGASLLAIAGAWRLLAVSALPIEAFALTADVRGDEVRMAWPGREWLTTVATIAGVAAAVLVMITLSSLRAATLALPAFALCEGLALTSISARFALDEGRTQLALALLIAACIAATVGLISALRTIRPGRALARFFPLLAAAAIASHLLPVFIPRAFDGPGFAIPVACIGLAVVALAITFDLEWIRGARTSAASELQWQRAAVLGATGMALSLGWLFLESLELARYLPGAGA